LQKKIAKDTNELIKTCVNLLEDKQNPYSDEKLAKLLTGEGIPIARRTVVKYRKALNISNMRHRKQF